jgi:hypothetical protein
LWDRSLDGARIQSWVERLNSMGTNEMGTDEIQTLLRSIIRLHSCELLRRMLQEANTMVPAVAGTDGGDIKNWTKLLADELAGRKDDGTKGTTLRAIVVAQRRDAGTNASERASSMSLIAAVSQPGGGSAGESAAVDHYPFG